ncbi:pantoate--beta-alanine ligase [Aciduricibacillus chroicocephali]|uniref:Pantothenate synthetase n=1 Tax=Aciduricibacillus chroicocephali TaxID=3054939 RepID=A0ABY9KYL9_9BACI|nr:pantoate--beta-alanine ligase [Bacillaceae bacterium 44XB]
MDILRTPEALRKILDEHKLNTIGYVPTMGYFHEGHLSLMDRASAENDIAVASIFVNPLQFGPGEDFEKYPRDEERDAALAEKAGIDYLFIPSVQSMYPHEMRVSLSMNKRTDILCGASRPGHFDGVVTVLAKLFNIVRPDHVYMGLKDAQQFAVVQSFCEDLNFPLELIGVPTVREADGLAKSSRNVFLTEKEREEAPAIYRALIAGEQLSKDPSINTKEVTEQVKQLITKNTSGTIDYVECLSYPDLIAKEEPRGKMILATAVKFSGARLIDNVIFDV